jgi:hypothetical protein
LPDAGKRQQALCLYNKLLIINYLLISLAYFWRPFLPMPRISLDDPARDGTGKFFRAEEKFTAAGQACDRARPPFLPARRGMQIA